MLSCCHLIKDVLAPSACTDGKHSNVSTFIYTALNHSNTTGLLICWSDATEDRKTTTKSTIRWSIDGSAQGALITSSFDNGWIFRHWGGVCWSSVCFGFSQKTKTAVWSSHECCHTVSQSADWPKSGHVIRWSSDFCSCSCSTRCWTEWLQRRTCLIESSTWDCQVHTHTHTHLL